MKNSLIILFTFYSTMSSLAQKVRLENDNSTYLCLNDSIADTFEKGLKGDKIDSTISILNDYDNGRLENSKRIIIYTKNGTSKMRVIVGCDKIIKDSTYAVSVDELWNYINVADFEKIEIPIKSGGYRSHDKFYYITITIPTRTFDIAVKDYERENAEKDKKTQLDTRVILTNKVIDILR